MKRADEIRTKMFTKLREDESYKRELEIVEHKIEQDLLKGETDVKITNLVLINDLKVHGYKVRSNFNSDITHTIYWNY